MQYELKTDYAADAALRAAFNGLAEQTFGLSFEAWYQSGCWRENYRPYTLFCGETAVSNVSVNPMRFRLDGVPKSAVQLGTVMTAPEHRNRGLAASLMQRALEESRPACDWLFLLANHTALGFYPRFEFERHYEYRCTLSLAGGLGTARQLDASLPENRALLLRHAACSNPFSVLTLEQNPELIRFYTDSFLRNNVYWIPEEDAVAIAEQDGETMLCYDIFCPARADRERILRAAAPKGTARVEFGFTPKETAGCRVEKITDDDSALFLLSGKENPFAERPLRFPLLSHT